MKNIIFTTICIIGCTSIFGQITFRTENLIDRAVQKPKSFDSLSNISMQSRYIDYRQYIGYNLFFLPLSKKAKQASINKVDYIYTNRTTTIKGKFGDWNTNLYFPYEIEGGSALACERAKLEGEYYTIVDITAKNYIGRHKLPYSSLNSPDITEDDPFRLQLNITLKNDLNGDTIYWRPSSASNIKGTPFFLLPYFEKKKHDFLKKSLVAMKDYNELIDSKTGEILSIKKGERWTCHEINFADAEYPSYVIPFLFLSNGLHEIAVKFDNMQEKNWLESGEYERLEAEKKKKEEDRIIAQQEADKLVEAQVKANKDYCVNKWGIAIGGLIADGKVKIGMDKDMCRTAWGNPIDINRTISSGLTHEQWVYGWATYLYFNNGKLTTIQD